MDFGDFYLKVDLSVAVLTKNKSQRLKTLSRKVKILQTLILDEAPPDMPPSQLSVAAS